MRRKIAVFSTPWSHEHIGGILMGMKKKAEETGTDLYIFNNHGGFEGEVEYNAGEYNIFKLPHLNRFDGVLIASNDVNSTRRIPKLIEKVNRFGLPCICLDQETEGARFIGTDNYKAMYEMVEHLVTEHQCRSLIFIGGPSDNVESALRKQGFLDVLNKYGLPAEKERIRDYAFTRNSVSTAYDDFDKDGLATPDAVVCANDDMATAYIDQLLDRGIRIPEDVIVTGFDYSSEGQNYFPELSSVERSREDLGYAAVTHLLELIEGKDLPQKIFAPHHVRPNASCGCHALPEDYIKMRRERISANRWGNDTRWQIHCMQKRLWVCEDEKQFKSILFNGLDSFNIHNLCIMVNDLTFAKEYDFEKNEDTDATGYPDQMRMFFWTKEPESEKEIYVDTESLIPDGFADPDAKSHVFIVMPLHMRGVNFGYSVMEDGLEHIMDGNLFYMLGVINASLESVRQSTYIRKINKKLNAMYMMDAMTGIYNRFALNALGAPLLKKNEEKGSGTLFLFADMDGLKVFNDTYGHDVGDAAIKCFAQIMEETCVDDTFFCIRYGGDEFLMMGTCESSERAEEILKSLENNISAFNEKERLPGRISASTGYILASPAQETATMDYYISKADEMMYQIKREKKRLKKLAEAQNKEEQK